MVALLGLIAATAIAQPSVPRLAVHMVDFVSSHSVTDAEQFYKDWDNQPSTGGGNYPPHELDSAQTISPVPWVVFPYGGSVTVQVKFYNPLSYQVSGTWSFDTATFAGSNLSKSQADTTITIPGHGTATKTAYITLPNSVSLGSVLVEFSADCGIIGDGGYEGVMFLTKDTPTGNMSDVWAEVLAYSCSWAEGDTSAEDCAYDCTFGLFYSQMFAYNLHMWDPDEEGVAIPTLWIDTNTDNFKLALFLGTSGYRPGNCVDVSSFNSLCIESLGVGVELNQQKRQSGFVTNPVCPIGSDSTQIGLYQLVPFSMHQQVHIDGYVYDAALAFVKDLSGDTYMNPPAGFPLPGYWQTPTGPSPPPEYGLTKRAFNSQYDWLTQNIDSGLPHYNASIFNWDLDLYLGSEMVSYTTGSGTFRGVQ